MNTTKIQFYDIILEGRLALMVFEYCRINKESNGFFWSKDNKLKVIRRTENLWAELIGVINHNYPEFVDKSKTFETTLVKDTRQYISVMRVAR